VPAFAPVTVGIPTWARGERILHAIDRILACDPRPAEIVVHVDAGDGSLESLLAARFPAVRVLVSDHRVGPGGGRHRCLLTAREPIFASFDDDSWPVDADFFAEVVRLFAASKEISLCAATIVHPWETMSPRADDLESVVEFTGCGWAVRRDEYLRCPGFVDRPLAYGIEESDLGLQLFVRGSGIVRSRSLRVFHDTQLTHHRRPEQAAASIQNVALLAWLRYPMALAPRAILQVLNMIADQARRGRWRGIPVGVLGIVPLLWRWRNARQPIPARAVIAYLAQRKRPSYRVETDLVPAPTTFSR